MQQQLNELDFWQKEATRHETSVHTNMTRTYALLGAGLTGVASVVIGVFVTKRAELLLIIPFVLLLLWVVVLVTLQEVLVKALYQYRAERIIASLLPDRTPENAYLTWEDVGGRIGNKAGSTAVFWTAVTSMTFLLGAGSVTFYLARTPGTILEAILSFPLGAGWLFTAIVVFAALLASVIITGQRVLRRYWEVRRAFGYDSAPDVAAVLPGFAGLVPHPQPAIHGDDSTGDIGGVV